MLKMQQKPFEPVSFVRKGMVTIEGTEIPYQVISEDNVLTDEEGAPKGSVFTYSYFRTDVTEEEAKVRPVLFAFNGGPGSSAEVTSLSQVASHFMSPALLTFFIVGGPICGIITSLVPVALACVALVEQSAREKVFPEFMAKQNKHGVAYWSLFLVMAIAIGICATGATFGVVMTIFSFCNTVAELPNVLSPILSYKKYPKCCDNSSVKMGPKTAQVLAIITFIVCGYLAIQMALTLDAMTVTSIFAVFAVGYLYFFIRVKYLKGKGVDLIQEMKVPYQPWEEKEASYQ